MFPDQEQSQLQDSQHVLDIIETFLRMEDQLTFINDSIEVALHPFANPIDITPQILWV